MAIKKVLLFAKRVAQGRVISILGCGGNRDQDKRAKMGTIASLYSDIAIFTEDNSRNEKTLDILKAMSVNVQKNVLWIENRQLAIQKALSLAKENDIILIMGKGNQQFLIANYGKIPYNDKAFILAFLRRKQNMKNELLSFGLSLVATVCIMPLLIPFLHKIKFGQSIRG